MEIKKRFHGKIASFSKSLPRNALGEVDIDAYKNLIKALKKGNPNDFEHITLGGVIKLAYGFEGADSHHLSVAVPPAFSRSWCDNIKGVF
ncbi:hypothetical protein [Bacillus sp. C1]